MLFLQICSVTVKIRKLSLEKLSDLPQVIPLVNGSTRISWVGLFPPKAPGFNHQNLRHQWPPVAEVI